MTYLTYYILQNQTVIIYQHQLLASWNPYPISDYTLRSTSKSLLTNSFQFLLICFALDSQAASKLGKLPVEIESHVVKVTGPVNRLLLTKEILEFCGALPIYNTEVLDNGTAGQYNACKVSDLVVPSISRKYLHAPITSLRKPITKPSQINPSLRTFAYHAFQ